MVSVFVVDANGEKGWGFYECSESLDNLGAHWTGQVYFIRIATEKAATTKAGLLSCTAIILVIFWQWEEWAESKQSEAGEWGGRGK